MGKRCFYNQSEFEIRCEWGMAGVAQLAPISDVVIIVDVLSFTSAVEIATQRGAKVYPYQGDNAAAYAAEMDALLAVRPGQLGYSLSPHSLVDIPGGQRLILPSPNGSMLTLATGDKPTLAGCLRNYSAIANAAMTYGPRIAVIPAGERWHDEGHTLRPAYEDWVGAGAIISQLSSKAGGRLSPEARAAHAAFQEIESHAALEVLVATCGSGKEHLGRDMGRNIPLVAAADVSDCVPLLLENAYVNKTAL